MFFLFFSFFLNASFAEGHRNFSADFNLQGGAAHRRGLITRVSTLKVNVQIKMINLPPPQKNKPGTKVFLRHQLAA